MKQIYKNQIIIMQFFPSAIAPDIIVVAEVTTSVLTCGKMLFLCVMLIPFMFLIIVSDSTPIGIICQHLFMRFLALQTTVFDIPYP